MIFERIYRLSKHLLAAGCMSAALLNPASHAQTLSVLYNFTNAADGGVPLAGLTDDGKGDLYGTTSGGALGFGTVFKLKHSSSGWTMDTLHEFAAGNDGAEPESRPTFSPDHSLYGTTVYGGAANAGVVYNVRASGESVIYTFQGSSDGLNPSPGELTFDKAGNIYGTTTYGGVNNTGTVYELVHPKTGGNWTKNILYSFGNAPDGTAPLGGVVRDKLGNLYGTTSTGGAYGYGAVYELKVSGGHWTESILYNFTGGSDGGTPYAGVIIDNAGNLYGGTVSGGGGGGAIFEMSPSNGSWTYQLLYGIPGGAISGPFRDLVRDAAGNVYGTTHCDGTWSEGTVYELSPQSGGWTYNLMYQFEGSAEGYYVFSNLVLDKSGNLYGTASVGGADGVGVIFELTP